MLWIYRVLAATSGNRTHYPNGLPRNGSELATDYRIAKGKVVILTPQDPPSGLLLEYQNNWAKKNGIEIEYQKLARTDPKMMPSNAHLYCEQGHFGADIIMIDATATTYVEKCFLDLWAWDDTFGRSMENNTIFNSNIRDKLVALPYATSTSFLIYNAGYLSSYGVSVQDPPKTMSELGGMISKILQNERGAENYKLVGITGGFKEPQSFMAWASELNHGVNGSLVDKNTGISIVYSDNFAEVVSLISEWLGEGVLDTSDLSSLDLESAVQKWNSRQAIFIRGNAEMLPLLTKYEFGTWPNPLYQLRKPSGVGTLEGIYAGVHQNGSNVAAAVKTLAFLTSFDYQRYVQVNKLAKTTPNYPTLFKDPGVCDSLGFGLCQTYAASQVALRPSKQTGQLYPNITSIITSTLMNMLNGHYDIVPGLGALDVLIRKTLGNPDNDGPAIAPVAPSTPKMQFKHLETQLLGLIAVISVIVISIHLYKRKMEWDDANAAKEPESIPLNTVKNTENYGILKTEATETTKLIQ